MKKMMNIGNEADEFKLEILTETRHISSSKNLRYPQVGGIEKT
jgi:hypothetical protein